MLISDVQLYVRRLSAWHWQLSRRTDNLAISSSDKSLQVPSNSAMTWWWQLSSGDMLRSMFASVRKRSSIVFISNGIWRPANIKKKNFNCRKLCSSIAVLKSLHIYEICFCLFYFNIPHLISTTAQNVATMEGK